MHLINLGRENKYPKSLNSVSGCKTEKSLLRHVIDPNKWPFTDISVIILSDHFLHGVKMGL